ncbi:hypothetical protein MY5147_005143 [Beauveria neobassiana]
MFALSEESKERIGKLIDISRVAWLSPPDSLPGYDRLSEHTTNVQLTISGYTRSDPKPSLIRLISPLS